MSLKAIARHRATTKKIEIATFDEWMAMRERLDEEDSEIVDGSEPEGKEVDLHEEKEPFTPRKRRRLDVPHPVCVMFYPSCRLR